MSEAPRREPAASAGATTQAVLTLAAHLVTLDPGVLEPEARAHVELVFDDTAACIVAGLREPDIASLAARLCREGAIDPLTGLAGSAPELALVFAIAGVALEFDEANLSAGGHPAVPVLAATLAESAARRLGRAEQLAAFLAGYEAAARIGYASAFRPRAHRHAGWGATGAAVACARLRGFSAERIAAAIDMAAGLSTAASSSAGRSGASVRHAAIGVAARNGILACDLVEAGIFAEPDACQLVFGEVLGDRFAAADFLVDLQSRYFILESFLKADACCREVYGVIRAFDAARGPHVIPPSDIHHLTVEAPDRSLHLLNPTPANALAARFSIEAILSEYILRGSVTHRSFANPPDLDRDLRLLTEKITVERCCADRPVVGLWRCHVESAGRPLLSGEFQEEDGGAPGSTHLARLKAKAASLHAG